MLEKEFKLFFGQKGDVGVSDQIGEVLADVKQYCGIRVFYLY